MDRVLSHRHALLAFWLGCAAVTAGVCLHLPMFLMAKDMGYVLKDMPMDPGMVLGMGLIVSGVGLTAYGLLPGRSPGPDTGVRVTPSEEAPLTLAHAWLIVVLIVALVVDIMKPASLGFVVPGMRAEYAISKAAVAWLPFSALLGTFVGSLVWGVLADIYGRRAAILLSAIMFVGTSICGAMPSFGWNVFMCFIMGAAAGGLLPVAYALLAETMPTRHRGLSLVLVGGLGAAGGYLASSASSAVLQPIFGWRIMWFLNLPTGLLLIAMNSLIPESAKFLLQSGRVAEAERILRRFGSVLQPIAAASTDPPTSPATGKAHFVNEMVILCAAALTWSLINFGILLWLPAELVARGYGIGATSGLLAQSALIALPTALAAAWLYSQWSSKGALVVMMAASAAGLLGIVWLDQAAAGAKVSPLAPVALLIFGANGLLAVLLPYTAELFPARIRGRATGLVAGCTKLGGLAAQILGLLALLPSLALAAWAIIGALAVSIALVVVFGDETRGRDLRRLDDGLVPERPG